ncbi:Predicted acyltransferase [bacterium A37T11]|nr:Predicted acyltransferase [bacterium A37T11]
MEPKKQRLLSIDALRALVMLLMIFVNDLWTLHGVPEWLEHTAAEADGMGLADTVFPAFLFIAGLSIPFAIQNRLSKGENKTRIFWHILQRSIALLVIGFFHVNLETYGAQAPLPKPIWEILLTIAVFLIWLNYPPKFKKNAGVLKAIGLIGLLILATCYTNASGAMGIFAMTPQWWGILGLIGWCYFLVASLFLWCGGKIQILSVVFILFIVFNMASQSSILDAFDGIRNYIWLVGDGSLPALMVAGATVSLLYTHFNTKKTVFVYILVGIAAIMILFGLVARQYWDLSKIRATPSFTLVCTGISMAAFAVVIWITDIRGYTTWYKAISPAGTYTLTCYLIPYLWYPLVDFIPWHLPLVLCTGIMGLAKSLVFAFLIILITGWLAKKGIRLKL